MSNLSKVEYISAGAGSGKTYSITERIVEAFRTDSSLKAENIIVTTFTRKAAAELRQRISKRLIEEGLFTPFSEIHLAKIGTVHSICQDYITQYAALVDLPPHFSVLEEAQKINLINELIDNYTKPNDLKLLQRIKQEDSEGYLAHVVLKVLSNSHSLQVSEDTLRKSAEESWRRLEAKLGGIDDALMPESFINAWKNAYQSFYDLQKDEELKGKSKSALETLRKGMNSVRLNELPPYDKLRSISGLTGIKKAHQPYIAELQELCNAHIHLQTFQEDLKSLIELIFELTIRVKESYKSIKKSRGFLDYDDMEAYMLELLEKEVFQSEFGSNIRWVLVDEFQDTNPVQLKIFEKWVELVERAIWVGDIKQSIYQFRGTDTELIESLLEKIPDDQIDTLPHSYRSRAELVNTASNYFEEVFKNEIRGDVKLLPTRDTDADRSDCIAPILRIQPPGKNKGQYTESIAAYIEKLISDKKQIIDKESKTQRPLKYEDVCVLYRSNVDAEKLVAVLNRNKIPTSVYTQDFYKSDRWRALDAALGLIINESKPWDQYTIRFFSEDRGDVHQTLKHRLKRIQEDEKFEAVSDLEKEIKAVWKSNKHQPLTNLITSLLMETQLGDLLQVLDGSVNAAKVIQAIIECTQTYEDVSNTLGRPKSMHGVRAFFKKNLVDAINEQHLSGVAVMTYHKSKGLEWPVVVMSALNNEPKGNYFDNPLWEDKHILFFPNPYHKQAKNNELFRRFSEEIDGLKEKEWKQEKRLLYVGFTRARETVILDQSKEPKWLDSALAKDLSNVRENIWSKFIPYEDVDEDCLTVSESTGSPQHAVEVPKRSRLEFHNLSPFFLVPSKVDNMPLEYELGEFIALGEYAPPLKSPTEDQESLFGDLVHQYMGFESNGERLISSFGMNKLVQEDTLREWKERLHAWIQTQWCEVTIHNELRISVLIDGQRIQGVADMVLEMENELIIIDHKTFPGGRSKLKDRIAEKKYALQLYNYKASLEHAFDKSARCFLHFPVSSTVVPIQYKNT